MRWFRSSREKPHAARVPSRCLNKSVICKTSNELPTENCWSRKSSAKWHSRIFLPSEKNRINFLELYYMGDWQLVAIHYAGTSPHPLSVRPTLRHPFLSHEPPPHFPYPILTTSQLLKFLLFKQRTNYNYVCMCSSLMKVIYFRLGIRKNLFDGTRYSSLQ